jgi:flagellar hook-length control protein FliK
MAAETAPAAATASSPTANTANTAAAPATASTTAAAHIAAQAAPVAVEGTSVTPEPRTDALTLASVAAAGASSDSSAAGNSSSDDSSAGGSADGFTGAVVRGLEARVDASALAATQAAAAAMSPEALASGALAAVPVPGLGSGPEATLRAIELPAAARFEQTLASLDPDVRNLQSMVRTVRLFTAGSGATEARLVLEPEHLGPVALTVRVEQGSVSAHFRAETPAAHRWIETHQQELRAGLREQGLEVKELVVSTDPDGRRERRQDTPAKPRPRRSQNADSPRFEVLV